MSNVNDSIFPDVRFVKLSGGWVSDVHLRVYPVITPLADSGADQLAWSSVDDPSTLSSVKVCGAVGTVKQVYSEC